MDIVEVQTAFPMRRVCRDESSRGYETPVDELTGLPLPILITEPASPNANTSLVDYHHHFHPKAELMGATDAEIALRRSRGQDLPRWLHEHYHKYFAGPEFPKLRSELFRTAVLGCAGVVPRAALDFQSNHGPRIRNELDDEAYGRIIRSVRHEGERSGGHGRFYRNQVGMFFANYAIEQSIEEVVSERVIDEFLHTRDPSRRKTLGNLLLREGVVMSVEPVQAVHAQVQREGLIKRKPTDLRAVVSDFFIRSRRMDYFVALDKKFSEAY